ncbi:beta-phosphoglucomutase family hydrolase [Coraliomargarita sp. W4R72]
MFKHHIRAVLFDLDGVVVFTDRFHELGWRKLAEDNDWEFSPELAHSLRGVSRMEALDVILTTNGVTDATSEQKQAWADVKNNYYREAVQGINDSDVLPGSLELIRDLRARGIKVALCSASKNAPEVLKLLNIGDLFDEVVCGLDVSRSKPDPQVFELAAERLGIPNFHCLVFEDAPSGVEGARRAGMKCVGIGDAAGLPEAPVVISQYSEIDLDALLDSARPYRPEPHAWRLVEDQFRSSRSHYWESMLAVTNGVLGVRGNLEEVTEGVPSYPATFVNGVVGYTDYQYMWKFPGFPERGHCIRNACEWTRVELVVDGERFDMNQQGLSEHRRWLDMATGSAHREFVWNTKSGVEVKVSTRRLASMIRREVAALEYSVSVSKACEVQLETISNGAPKSGHFPEAGVECAGWEAQGELVVGQLESSTSSQKMAVAQSVQIDGTSQTAVNEGAISRVEIVRSFDAAGSFSLSKRIAITSDLERPDADLVADAYAVLSHAPAIEALFVEQAEYWKEYWALADIEIEGDPLDQLGVRLSLYHNRQSLPEDGVRSVSANGQSGDNYGGHVFWDTEMYVMPPVLYTEPKRVRGVLEYRYGILDKAREQARRMQGKGALYSWNSITGEECAHVYEASTAEYHLQSAVAWGVDRYVNATGDTDFLYDMGAEMIFETARFLRDRGTFVPHKGDRFCINVVCGPNEYSCGVDNNAYTNYFAQWHLFRAAEVFATMQKDAPERLDQLSERIGVDSAEVAAWRDAAERMYLPWDEELGIIPQDDQFLGRDPVDMSKIPLHTDVRSLVHPLNLWRMQLIKQADTVLLLFLFRHLFDEETVRKTYEFHEPKTNHGSSLSACMHSIVANDLDKDEDAYHFFRETALMDINDLKGNTSGGVHSACLGGTWMTVVHGFGGFRDTPDGLVLNPKLPEQWSRFSFPLVWRGSQIRVECSGEGVTISHLSGPAISFKLGTEKVSISVGGKYIK